MYMWVVYLLKQNTSGELYIGVTSDLQRRLQEHNSGNQTATHRVNGKWLLVYAEAYRSKIDAFKREQMLKHHGSSKQKLYLRIQNSLEAE